MREKSGVPSFPFAVYLFYNWDYNMAYNILCVLNTFIWGSHRTGKHHIVRNKVFLHTFQCQWLALGELMTSEHKSAGFSSRCCPANRASYPIQNQTREFPAIASFFPLLYFSLWFWATQGSNRLFTPSRLQNSFYLRLPESAEFSCFQSSQRSLQISSLWKVTCQGTHFSWLTTSI